ncbi:hypothetical protein APS56_01370 [Pseudalgibacter alginicilyticus]|uniref:Thioredoxin domain-containing protein n=1 Tax=Pseudalgibacter alginicilyticus TaxID=1736674 RepID=A0A0P0CU68_9FLAO|nr:TlpA disulfide reductase family protein [Pseudalgibacter alginicilyticus]ALJ03882.1 hypothetical protein APS56_01370 [Pseudalgibacter alginicilyticus]
MKFALLTAFTCLFLACNTSKKDRFIINGEAPGVLNGIRAYIKTVDEQGRLINKDTAIVMNEQFSFEGTRNEPNLEFLFIDGQNGNAPFIVENGTINIIAKKDSLHTSKISGTTNNENLSSFFKDLIALRKKQNELINTLRTGAVAPDDTETNEALTNTNEKISDLPFNFTNKYNNSYAAVIVLENKTYDPQAPLDKVENSFNGLSDNLKSSKYGKRISDYITAKKTEKPPLAIGDIAPDFSAPTPEGNSLALNDIKGKVTIIDFWASWCAPCRRENPNVVRVYNKYHSKGLEIIGVSLDKENQKEAWIKAIADDKLTWHQVANLTLQDPIAELYNVTSIPATYILDQEGKIIAKNLRGQALENKIAELLN